MQLNADKRSARSLRLYGGVALTILPLLLLGLAACSEEPETYSEGRLELTRPNDLWHRDEEITGMLTLKRGVDIADAVARCHPAGFVTPQDPSPGVLLEDRIRQTHPELTDLVDAGSGDQPRPWSAREFTTPDGYRNHVRLYKTDDRYFVFALSAPIDEFAGLEGELEALTASLTIAPPPPREELAAGEAVVLDGPALVPAGTGWSARHDENEVLLERGGALILFYKRHPHTGGGESFDLAAGLRQEIRALHDNVEFDGPARFEEEPFPAAFQAYTVDEAWHYDAAALIGKSYYLVDGSCPAGDAAARELVEESVDSLHNNQ